VSLRQPFLLCLAGRAGEKDTPTGHVYDKDDYRQVRFVGRQKASNGQYPRASGEPLGTQTSRDHGLEVSLAIVGRGGEGGMSGQVP